MINPHLLQPSYGKVFNPKDPNGKYYCAVVGRQVSARASRKTFKTATLAKAHAERLVIRWRRLYDAAIIQEVQG